MNKTTMKNMCGISTSLYDKCACQVAVLLNSENFVGMSVEDTTCEEPVNSKGNSDLDLCI